MKEQRKSYGFVTKNKTKKVFKNFVFYCLCFVLLTVFGARTVMGANITVDINGLTTVGTIQTAIQTGITTIGAGDTVTVINSGSAFSPTARLQLNIPANKTVDWNLEFSTSSNFGNPLLTITGDGAFMVAPGGSLVRTGSGETIRSEGEYASITVHGIVSSNTARAIHVLGENSTVTIDNGTVSSSSNTPLQAAIYIENTANTRLNVIVKGDGRVLANTDGGYAIMSYGNVEINDNALVSARNSGVAIDALGTQSTVTVNGGTISTTGGPSSDAVGGSAISCHYKIIVNGGTVSATTGKAVHTTDANSSIIINGGTIHATTGYAIRTDYNTTSTIEINGGFVFAYGNNLSGVINNSSYTLPGGSNGIIVAWNNSIPDPYIAFTTTALSINPPTPGIASWRNNGTSGGIRYTNGTNTGFFPLPVIVNLDTDYGLIFDSSSGKLYLDVAGNGIVNPIYEYFEGQGITWMGVPGSLELTGFSWTTPAPVALRIVNDDATLILSDLNSFVTTNGGNNAYGIYSSYNLTLDGTGTIITQGDDRAIYINPGTLNFPIAYTYWTGTDDISATQYWYPTPGPAFDNSNYSQYVKIRLVYATVANTIIKGSTGKTLAGGQTATITLTGDSVVTGGLTDVNANGWFTNLPNGITVIANATEGSNTITLTFGGTPTELSLAQFEIVIPGSALEGGDTIMVIANPDAKFAIGRSYIITNKHTTTRFFIN